MIRQFRSLTNKLLPNTLRQRLRPLFYKGNVVHCPICNGNFRKFLVSRGRPNVKCPKCDSRNRHRLLWLYLENKTTFFQKENHVLHFAPEKCFEEKLSTIKNLHYITGDLDPHLAMLMIDITNIQFKECIFNYVLCSHVLEHIPDDIQAMKEVLRILKPEGIAIFQVPVLREKTFEDPSITIPQQRLKLFGQTDHVRIYGKDIEDRLIKAGFKVDTVRYGESLGENAVIKYGLDPTEELYICKKS